MAFAKRRARDTIMTYPWSHLLPSRLMLLVVCLRKDIVPSILNTAGRIIPFGTLIAGLIIDMNPHIGIRSNQDVWSNPCYWACIYCTPKIQLVTNETLRDG